MTQAYVIPRPLGDGLVALVRQPDRSWTPLPPEGGWVQLDEYWSRRLRDRDVLEAEPPVQAEDDPAPSETSEPTAAKRRGR